MVMLSKLRRFRLVDDAGRHARLADLAVALLDGDYPPVTHLFFFSQAKKQFMRLPWEAVKSFNAHASRILVADLDAAEEVSLDALDHDVLLHHDILDALVLDLQNRRSTRANDLQLEEEDGKLLLRAADTSFQAILRRLTRGRYSRVATRTLYDWKYVEFLRGDPQAVRNGAGYHLRITRLPPGEIATLTNPLPYLHAAELITLLPDEKAADTLEAMSPERQLQVFEELDEEQAVKLLALMAPDGAADLIGRLQTKTMKRYLELLPKKQGERIIELLRYPEDTVGGIMTNDVVCVPVSLTVAETREQLRELLKEPDFVFLIYLVDDLKTRRLRGLISLRNVVTAQDDEKLEDLMDPYVTTLGALEPARDAAYRVINSHLAGMPVVGNEGQLLGVLCVDAAIVQVAPANWTAIAPRIFS
ncbi:MAG TPA: CBS domain-containing protein [Pyrinomonadaceae bacterium]|jgi:CBS domain-containing protein|nr:CBS domain-containing protein [Pyrinomonadaceae bacterium]